MGGKKPRAKNGTLRISMLKGGDRRGHATWETGKERVERGDKLQNCITTPRQRVSEKEWSAITPNEVA